MKLKQTTVQHANAVIDIVIVLPIKDLNEKKLFYLYFKWTVYDPTKTVVLFKCFQ